MSLYAIYEHRIFPRLLDHGMRPLEPYRGDVVAKAHGQVLEIGFGTGLNLIHYGDRVQRVIGIDPMDAVPVKIQARIDLVSFPVERHFLRADGELPFADDTFDSLVMTWTLCTIPDAHAALREMHRVMRKGAPLHFVEHGASDSARIFRWQERLNRLQNVIGCGCNLNRHIDQLIESAGFELETLERFDAPRLPRTHAHLYRGVARAT